MEQKLSETDRKLFYVKLPLLLLLSSFSPFLLAPAYLLQELLRLMNLSLSCFHLTLFLLM